MPASKPVSNAAVNSRPNAPRNTSIDSAVSSISSNVSAANLKPSSSSMANASPPDFAALIQSAGSPEAALQDMWHQKCSIYDQNSKLWRIARKQNEMLAGLNKDLESALKDRDRCRKMLKQVNALPSAVVRVDTPDREASSSPVLSERREPLVDSKAIGTPDALPRDMHPLSREVSVEQETLAGQQLHHPHLPPSSTPLAPDRPNDPAPAAASMTGPASASQCDESRPSADNPTRDLRLRTLHDQAVSGPSLRAQAPSLSLTAPTPVLGSNDFPSPDDRHPRKPPPAPLKLSNPQRPANRGDVDSDLDVPETDKSSSFKRGRKKTREEDDWNRELLIQKEAEERGRSKKSRSKSKSKSKSKSGDRPGQVQLPLEDSASTVATTFQPPIAPGLPISPRLRAHASINALLSPTRPDNTNLRIHNLNASLQSPGLPKSPRPGSGTSTQNIAVATVSSHAMNGLPLSPRASKAPLPLPSQTHSGIASPRLARPDQRGLRPTAEDGTLAVAPKAAHSSSASSNASTSGSEPPSPDGINRKLVSDQWPGLLLPPIALPFIQVKVFSSHLRPSRQSSVKAISPCDQTPVFTLAIHSRLDGKQLWRLEKSFGALSALDQSLRNYLHAFAAPIPNPALFSGRASREVDARGLALITYFDKALEGPMTEPAALVVCRFLSSDAFGVEPESPKSMTSKPAKETSRHVLSRENRNGQGPGRLDNLQATRYESTVAADAPIMVSSNGLPTSSPGGSFLQDRIISGPTNGAVIQNAELWGNRSSALPTPPQDKKQGMFSFSSKRVRSSTNPSPGPPARESTPDQGRSTVWGVPLEEAVAATRPEGVRVLIPAVVHRTIEYLDMMGAHREVGIFRLSGPDQHVKELKDLFDTKRDVVIHELMSRQGVPYDVHSVASLLKSYIREIPGSLFTKQLQPEFYEVSNRPVTNDQKVQQAKELKGLVDKLPRANRDVIRAVWSYLVRVTENKDVNKMSPHNLSLVLAPTLMASFTLMCPAPLVTMPIEYYDYILGDPRTQSAAHFGKTTPSASLSSVSIRLPHHQMSSTPSTPTYRDTFQKRQHQRKVSSLDALHEAHQSYDSAGFGPKQPSYNGAAAQSRESLVR